MTLDEMPRDRRGVVTALDTRGAERRRLMDLGLLPGAAIAPELTSPLGDPVAYEVRGTLVVLRAQQARTVHVELEEH
ncbi:ferrous iron transport protein A [Actinomycetospora sp. NBRC 106375]|uniref:FeoA family protein n=1 Tax=Actinomycetospora sp. NBRC 106375 TaxID=3032207 RepID=UPI0024A5356B|nr:FeoA family protein [Actinomycetospora sp. NBRC 106375]GLZ45482.1 ferrous iron transport protein A [Actinomycetospora sp. NBRC 106375]